MPGRNHSKLKSSWYPWERPVDTRPVKEWTATHLLFHLLFRVTKKNKQCREVDFWAGFTCFTTFLRGPKLLSCLDLAAFTAPVTLQHQPVIKCTTTCSDGDMKNGIILNLLISSKSQWWLWWRLSVTLKASHHKSSPARFRAETWSAGVWTARWLRWWGWGARWRSAGLRCPAGGSPQPVSL